MSSNLSSDAAAALCDLFRSCPTPPSTPRAPAVIAAPVAPGAPPRVRATFPLPRMTTGGPRICLFSDGKADELEVKRLAFPPTDPIVTSLAVDPYSRSGFPWSEDDDRVLRDNPSAPRSLLAAILRRSPGAVETRINRLKRQLAEASQVTSSCAAAAVSVRVNPHADDEDDDDTDTDEPPAPKRSCHGQFEQTGFSSLLA